MILILLTTKVNKFLEIVLINTLIMFILFHHILIFKRSLKVFNLEIFLIKLKQFNKTYIKNIIHKIKKEEKITIDNNAEDFIITISNYSLDKLLTIWKNLN